MNSIEINELSKAFAGKTVLSSISVNIQEGEIFGLLGPSGAGKTTLIKILTGQLKSDSGEAKLLDRLCNQLDDETYRQIGMLLDTSGIYERLSCYDNLRLFTRLYRIPKERIKEVLDVVGLKDATKTSAGKLSKGMKSRLSLARAILHAPKLLFLDEPTSGLDPTTAKAIHELLFKLQQAGTTIFLTTHQMEEATKLCQYIALLDQGVIVEYGAPEAICRKYNKENRVKLLLKDGSLITLTNGAESAEEIATYFREGRIEAIHSSEPNLEEVFMRLTGRELE